MTLTNPTRKSNILVQNIGGETLLYNAEADTIHVLNPTAKLIWELCDGTHSVADIERLIRENFSMAAEQDVSEDVQHTLKIFADKGLLEQTD